jgi:hypothetical protein
MALARARAFQQKQQEESAAKKIEKLFQITVTKGGDAGTYIVGCSMGSFLT